MSLNVTEKQNQKIFPFQLALTSHLLCACITGYLTFEGFQLISPYGTEEQEENVERTEGAPAGAST